MFGCGQPCDGYHYSCTCQQCGVILLNGICLNCTYGDGKPITCCVCEGPLTGRFCLFCDLKAENSSTYDPDAYSFNDTSSNFNHLPQPQYEPYFCELCENDLHFGYDCQQQFSLVYEQEPSYNQNYNDNYYPHDSPSFLCCDNCGESHETFQCQPMNQNTDSSSFDQIQMPQYPYKEYLKNSSNAIVATNSDIHQLIREEGCIEVCKEQNKNMEDTMLELLEVCRQKEFYCMHNDVDGLIESALNSKLLSINLRSQHLDKKKEEVKNIVEHSTKRGTRIARSLQNFRIKKSSTSLNNTSQISPVHAFAPVLPTEEHEHSLSMGYEHLSTNLETESDEVIKSSVKNLVPILIEYEVASGDESECNVPVKDESSPVFTTFSNPIFDDNDDFTSSDDESLSDEDVPMEDFKVYSNPLFDNEEFNSDKLDPHCFNIESDLIESLSIHDTLIDSSLKREHEEYISLIEKLLAINSVPRPLENFHANTIVETLPTSTIPVGDGDSLRVEIDIFTGTDSLLPLEGEIDVFANFEDDDYFPFIIRIFLPYLIYPEVFPLLVSAESEDTIFDPGISTESRWHFIGMELSYDLMFI
uniref:Pre-mRNA splicing Prp18-interacting factor n=1 Tax=Tanacetum cinerariifolium TaxID=118510 RepID=A0A6L2KA41_TANCI|nr:hypothetical protein [Tanacetum cinerariifolium]